VVTEVSEGNIAMKMLAIQAKESSETFVTVYKQQYNNPLLTAVRT
jgi:hypothetical protein